MKIIVLSCSKNEDTFLPFKELMEATEIAKSESGYFSLPKIREIIEK